MLEFGRRGAGKFELVLALAGMLPISAGAVSLDGQFLKPNPESIRRLGIAAVHQGHRVLTALSVDDNLRAEGTLLGPKARAQVAEVYTIFPEPAERKSQIADRRHAVRRPATDVGPGPRPDVRPALSVD